MEYEKNICPVLDVDGILATGKQFDLDITLPEDNRSVIYGIVKDCYQEPVCDAVVKLVEVVCERGKEERRPVSHTFTDDNGEFVFGPLCANRFYEIEIWVDRVKHCKICTKVERDVDCLKGVKLDCKKECKKTCHKEEYNEQYDKCMKDKEEKKCCKECNKDKEYKDDKECCKKQREDKECKECCEKQREDKECKEWCEKRREDKECKEYCEKQREDKECKECCEKQREDKECKECDKKDDKCDRRPYRPFCRPF